MAELSPLRVGKLTASRAAVIMGGLDTSGLATLTKRLAWERVYGDTAEAGYRGPAMERGQEVEPAALDWYEFQRDLELARGEFVQHPTIAFVSSTPDGLAPGLVVEAKSPLHGAWMEVKRTGLVPAEYRWQCRWQQWCAGVGHCDFVCYHPVAGGLIVPTSVTDSEIDQMAERAYVVDAMVQKWVDVLQTRKAA